VNVSCNGFGNGSIDLTVTGGTAPYTYAWSLPSSNQDIFNLVPGTYIVTVTDANQCVATANYVITEPDVLDLTEVITHVSCNGLGDGMIDITVTGGTIPYSYNWSNGQVSEDIAALSPGTYSVTVTDANECEIIRSFTVTEPDVLAASTTSVNASCNGFADGSIDLSVIGGTMPYTYAWSNSETTEDISGLTAGVYTVTVTDDHGCQVTASVTVTEPDVLVITVDNIDDASCGAVHDGAIDISVSGGTLPYTYAWSNGATTEDISSIPGGLYNITVTDANGCVEVLNDIQVGGGSEITLSAVITHVHCDGGNQGSVVLTPSGGTAPYGYLWSNGQTVKDILGVEAGLYTVIVTDANGCTATGFYSVIDSTMSVDIWVEAASCGLSSGSINLQVSGGSGSYQYDWVGGNSATATMLLAGSYSVTITDLVTGCVFVEDEIVVPNQDGPEISGLVTDASCGVDDGAITIAVTGVLSYTINWSNGGTTETISNLAAGEYCVTVTAVMPEGNECENVMCFTVGSGDLLIQAAITDATCGQSDGEIALVLSGAGPFIINWSTGSNLQTLPNLSAGVYIVTVVDVSTGCIGTQVFAVQDVTGPSLNGTVVQDPMCASDHDGFIDLAVTGTGPFTFLWSTGETTEDLSSLTAGEYAVMVTDANGCRTIASYSIGEPSPLEVVIETTPDCVLLEDPQGVIAVTVSGGKAPYTYTVVPAVSGVQPPFSGLRADTYNITITDDNGCMISGTAVVLNDEKNPDCALLSVQVPDVLTPNNDGIMDEWNIENIEEYPDNEVIIFNRWGDVVFRTTGYTNDWYGTYMDTDRILPDGTYYYIVNLNDNDDRKFQGFVMIYR
jgi:gliding motility-associated-like protein